MQYKLGYLWKGKGTCHDSVLVAARALPIAPVVLSEGDFDVILMFFSTKGCWQKAASGVKPDAAHMDLFLA